MTSGDARDLSYCYLTTTGRLSGRPHRIEIWFAIEGGILYLLSGGGTGSDWVRNLLASPDVTVEVGAHRVAARARLVEDPGEDALARRLLLEKYTPRDADDLTGWSRSATPVAIDVPAARL